MFITLQVITVVFYRPIARLFQGGGARLHCKEALSSYAVWDSAVSSYQCGVGQNASCKHFYAFRGGYFYAASWFQLMGGSIESIEFPLAMGLLQLICLHSVTIQ